MSPSNKIILFEPNDGLERVQLACETLLREANARAVFVLDQRDSEGPPLAQAGHIEGLSIASLTTLPAGSVRPAGGLAALIQEGPFDQRIAALPGASMYVATVADRALLVVVYDGGSTIGLVRLRARTAVAKISAILVAVPPETGGPPFDGGSGSGGLGGAAAAVGVPLDRDKRRPN